MLFKLVCAICVAGVTAGLFNFNGQNSRPWLQNLNIGNSNNRIRDTFMSGVLRGKNSRCNGTGMLAATEGECKPQKECRKQGGTASGTCALVGSCCILQNTCGATTRSKISYFVNPLTIEPSCALSIAPFSPNVCQIRLDFLNFQLEPPPSPTATNPGVAPLCNDDTFTVMGSTARNLGFDVLCGENTGQHIYIPVSNSTVTLQFNLQALRTALQVQNPNWRIKITQLECTTTIQDYSSLQSALTSLYQKHNSKKNPSNDRDLIAPPGCLQYFNQPTGMYESFNYNSGRGPMLPNLNYAICFKKEPQACGLTHTPTQLVIGNQNPGADCRSDPTIQDWLLIPESTITLPDGTTVINDYYCGIIEQPIPSYPSGPFYVGVRTDQNSAMDIERDGFQINYNTVAMCSQNRPI